jgi:hypothetical protein
MRLNNKKLAYFRKQQFYDAIFADLVLMGALPQDLVENYFNAKIPPELSPPYKPDYPYPTQPVDQLDIKQYSNIVAPVSGATVPAADFDVAGSQYTGKTKWYVGNTSTEFTGTTFGSGAIYIAAIKLTAKPGYTFEGLAGNDFTFGTGSSAIAATAGLEGIGSMLVTFPATS